MRGVGQGWGVKQGIRWLGLVLGLVLSKGAKVWFSVGCLVGVLSKDAKQGC